MQEMEGIRATRVAVQTFTPESLGSNSNNAGGAKCRDRRFEVLDRLARYRAGLSPGQKNDWRWFKESWDAAMVTEHGAKWAETFSGWIQEVLDDDRSNGEETLIPWNCGPSCARSITALARKRVIN